MEAAVSEGGALLVPQSSNSCESIKNQLDKRRGKKGDQSSEPLIKDNNKSIRQESTV